MKLESKKLLPFICEAGYSTLYTIGTTTYLGANFSKTLTAGIVVSVNLIESWCCSYFKDKKPLPWDHLTFSRDFFSVKTQVELWLTPALAATLSLVTQLIFFYNTPLNTRGIVVISSSTMICKFTCLALKKCYRTITHGDVFKKHLNNSRRELLDLRCEEKFLIQEGAEILKDKKGMKAKFPLCDQEAPISKEEKKEKELRKIIGLESLINRRNRIYKKLEILNESLYIKVRDLESLKEKKARIETSEICYLGTTLLSFSLNVVPFVLKKSLV